MKEHFKTALNSGSIGAVDGIHVLGEIPIFISCDDNYVSQACVVIASVKANTKANIGFHIIHSGLSELSKSLISETCGDSHLTFDSLESYGTLFEKFNIKCGHITVAACYRYMIPLIDKISDKGIYLDCDLIVRGDISELFTIDLGESYLAAADDFQSDSYIKKMSLNRYFNSGVLLLNLKRLRDENMPIKLIEKTAELNGKIKYIDQDVLNIVLGGCVKFLPTKWGAISPIFRKKIVSKFVAKSEIDDAVENPSIVHFTGPDKPWIIPFGITSHPWTPAYFYYMSKTPFAANAVAIIRNFRFINRFFWYWKRHLLFFMRPHFYKMRRLRAINIKRYKP